MDTDQKPTPPTDPTELWKWEHGLIASAYIEPGSELDGILQTPEIDGDRIIFSDLYGWDESFNRIKVWDHIRQHGRIATWDDFSRLPSV